MDFSCLKAVRYPCGGRQYRSAGAAKSTFSVKERLSELLKSQLLYQLSYAPAFATKAE
jgi:hypothetical protein